MVAIGTAFLIGASMIVSPCGYPSVFAIPSILTSRSRLRERTILSVVFVAASALPLAALGVGLAFAGDGVLGLLDSMKARMGFAVLLYTLMGSSRSVTPSANSSWSGCPRLPNEYEGRPCLPRKSLTKGLSCWVAPWAPEWAWPARCPLTTSCSAG